jgi:hypothetical protein
VDTLRPSRRTNRTRCVRDEPSAILRVRSVAAAPSPPDNPAVVRGSGCALSDMELELIWGELDEDEAGESDGQLDYEVRATRRAGAVDGGVRIPLCCTLLREDASRPVHSCLGSTVDREKRTLLALSTLVSGRLWTERRGPFSPCPSLRTNWTRLVHSCLGMTVDCERAC